MHICHEVSSWRNWLNYLEEKCDLNDSLLSTCTTLNTDWIKDLGSKHDGVTGTVNCEYQNLPENGGLITYHLSPITSLDLCLAYMTSFLRDGINKEVFSARES